MSPAPELFESHLVVRAIGQRAAKSLVDGVRVLCEGNQDLFFVEGVTGRPRREVRVDSPEAVELVRRREVWTEEVTRP